jgi:hypothetical protein
MSDLQRDSIQGVVMCDYDRLRRVCDLKDKISKILPCWPDNFASDEEAIEYAQALVQLAGQVAVNAVGYDRMAIEFRVLPENYGVKLEPGFLAMEEFG